MTLVSEENGILCATEEQRVDGTIKPIGKIWELDEADGSISNYLSTCLHLKIKISSFHITESLIKITAKE